MCSDLLIDSQSLRLRIVIRRHPAVSAQHSGRGSYNASKAAIRVPSESLRLQLADTTVKVIELVPPAVRTARLPGQEDSDEQPDAREIQVERVKFLRYGEARGDYDQVVAALNAYDPHTK
jgi:uncharacterized oxidoreductase